MVTGGWSGRRGETWLLRKADMKALRAMTVDARHGALDTEMCRWWATRSAIVVGGTERVVFC